MGAEVLAAMAERLRHRGPDEKGSYLAPGVGLANSRLSIIDLHGGSQPIWNEDRTVCVVFNGEIYNHLELRNELSKCGHRFVTSSDTEVLVHLYEEYGQRFVTQLNGMFAVAVWDARQKTGLLARDRIGIKPLYHANLDGRVLFASEIKSILEFPGFGREVNHAGLDQYLTLRYLPGEVTMFTGIKKLLPGHMAAFDGSGGSFEVSRYWDPPAVGVGTGRTNEREVVGELQELLRDAVRLRLMSDVPFGAFLSGGLDSSGIVALMAQEMSDPVKTFSIGFSEMARLDERKHARLVADKFGTHHREVDCTAERVELLPKLLYHFDEPFADPIIVPTYQLSQLAREHVKVVLTGEGADELFGGYSRFSYDRLARGLAQLPEPLRRMMSSLSRGIPATGPRDQLQRLLRMSRLSGPERFTEWVSAFGHSERARLYNPDVLEALDGKAVRLYERYAAELNGAPDVEQMLYCDLKIRLPECMLSRTDRMTMAVSLEGRTPFLDHRFVERVLTLPHQLKMRRGTEKYILRRVLARLLPRAIVKRKKQGLAVPFAIWTKYGIEKHIRRILSKESVARRSLFDPHYVQTLLNNWGPLASRHSQLVWSLLCLELWFRMYMDSPGLDPETPLSHVA